MSKVIFAINMSIDGCVEHTRISPPCEEGGNYINDLIKEAGLIAYGRKTYQIMFPYWAEEENWDNELDREFGQKVTGVEKIVFSRTLESAAYNTRIVHTDPATELLKLKQTPGKDIFISTVSMLPQLMQQGVIDEYHLLVSPAIVANGTRLLANGAVAETLKLKFVGSQVFKSGTVALRYVKG